MNFQNWQKLMQVFGLLTNQKTYDQLIKAYAEKHRHYHTDEHINACLKHLGNSRQIANHPHEIEIALWFHDAIYQPYAKDNELRSAILAKEFLLGNGVEEQAAQRVYELIMVTLHNVPTKTSDEALMVDIDLTILGTKPKIYNVFENNVRKEYRWLPFFYYRKKRKEVLKGFIDKDRIYQTGHYFDLFEQQARENIQQALLTL